jgi:hypothetical protein
MVLDFGLETTFAIFTLSRDAQKMYFHPDFGWSILGEK